MMQITVRRDRITRSQRVFEETAMWLEKHIEDLEEQQAEQFYLLNQRLDRIEQAIADLPTPEDKLAVLRRKLLNE
jgi:DNA-directed RNA polymerase specialized sigma24 family protein